MCFLQLKDPAVLNKLTDGENINYAALGSTIDKLKDTMANVYDGSETATAAQLKRSVPTSKRGKTFIESVITEANVTF